MFFRVHRELHNYNGILTANNNIDNNNNNKQYF